MLEKLVRLFFEYVLLPITGLIVPLVKFVVAQILRFVNWNWRLWVGPIWVRADEYALWAAVIVATILELVFEGWLLRRINNRVKHNLGRRALIFVVVMGFYLIACLQMAVLALLLGVNNAIWPIWITITVLHIVGWAANTILKAPFAWFWNWIHNLRPKYVIITAAGNGRKAWNYAIKADGRNCAQGIATAYTASARIC